MTSKKRRFYAFPLESHTSIDLASREAHHLRSVLRARPGDEILLFDGRGKEAPAVVEEIDSSRVRVQVGKVNEKTRQVPLEIHLALAVCREKAWTVAIKGAVELGVTSIQPVMVSRSRPLPSSKWPKKKERWEKIIRNACKQCGANIIPTLHPILEWGDFLSILPPAQKSTRILASSRGEPLAQILPTASPEEILLALGPEGGLREDEEEALRERGFEWASLGPRTLRVETAVVAAISRLLGWKEMEAGEV